MKKQFVTFIDFRYWVPVSIFWAPIVIMYLFPGDFTWWEVSIFWIVLIIRRMFFPVEENISFRSDSESI
jgi:membrane protein insertase Oxa1/YidC/SpoIIIJ